LALLAMPFAPLAMPFAPLAMPFALRRKVRGIIKSWDTILFLFPYPPAKQLKRRGKRRF